MRRSRYLGQLVLLAIAACSESPAPTTPSFDAGGAPAIVTQAIPNRYIVVYRKGAVADVDGRSLSIARAERSRAQRVFRAAIQGFVADLDSAALARVRARPEVAYVEQDQVIHINTIQAPTPSWGLDRIDQANLPLNNSFTYNATGAGVRLYGIDTGIFLGHSEFGGRASFGFDAFGGTGGDCNGHGTHTASTAAGSSYGVAKNMTIIAVRVLDCLGNGTTSGVIAGVDWVAQHRIRPAVANMSLGGGFSSSLNAAVAASVDSGVVYAISAGNSNASACNESPSSEPKAITVGSTTITDARSSFSNTGTCLDLFGPGSNITAAWIGGPSATNTISGTSMATPHVAGVAGQYLELNPSATPAQVAAAIVANATNGKVSNPGNGSPNKLLNLSFIGPPAGSNNPPVAAFLYSCNGSMVCSFNGNSSSDDHGVVTWSWQIGSRPVVTGAIVSAQWFSPRQVPVTLTVGDAGSLNNSVSINVNIAPNSSGGSGPSNQAPSATITAPANGNSFNPGISVSFTGSGTDPEQGPLSGAALVWTSSINGQIGTGTTFSTSTLSAGTHTITLTATDNQSATGTASVTVTINRPPTAAIGAPADGSHFSQGASVTFTGSGSDPEQGSLSGAALQWTSSSDGAIGSGASFSTTSLSLGTHTITLTATDNGGLSATATIQVTIDPPGSTNQPPTAAFTYSCTPSRLCTFNGDSSTDDNGVVSWSWQVGTRPTMTGAIIQVQWFNPFIVPVSLTVTDAGGLTNKITKQVSMP